MPVPRYSRALKSITVAAVLLSALAASSCSSTGGTAPSSVIPTNTIQTQSSSKSFVFSLSPSSVTYLHATSPAQTITFVVADQRTLTLAVQDPTVASAVLNPGTIGLPNNAGFQGTITVTPLKAGVTNLFINTQQGTVATVPIDVYGELQASPVTGNVIKCKNPSSCTGASTLGGASVNFNEQFYPNSYTLTADTCQTANDVTVFATGGTYALQLTDAAYATLVANAIAANQKTESLTCTTTVNATEAVTTTQTITVQFQTLQRGAGL